MGRDDPLDIEQEALAARIDLRQVADDADDGEIHPLPMVGQTIRQPQIGPPRGPGKAECETQQRDTQPAQAFEYTMGKTRQQQHRGHQRQQPKPTCRRQACLLLQQPHAETERDESYPHRVSRSEWLQHPVHQPQLPFHACGKFDVVRDDDQAGVLFAVEVAHQVEHRIGRVAVEIAGRLVGQDARWPRDQCAGNGDTLTLAAGKLARDGE